MEAREQKLLDNDLFLAAIYLDPRYLTLILKKDDEDLNNNKEERARKKLFDIWNMMKSREKRYIEQQALNQPTESQEVFSLNFRIL